MRQNIKSKGHKTTWFTIWKTWQGQKVESAHFVRAYFNSSLSSFHGTWMDNHANWSYEERNNKVIAAVEIWYFFLTSVSQYGPQLPSEAALHQHIQVLPILEGLVELHDKLAVSLAHDLLLAHDVLLLARLHNLRLLHLFQREGATRLALQLHQLHTPEAAHAQCGNDAEIRQSQMGEFFIQPRNLKNKMFVCYFINSLKFYFKHIINFIDLSWTQESKGLMWIGDIRFP